MNEQAAETATLADLVNAALAAAIPRSKLAAAHGLPQVRRLFAALPPYETARAKRQRARRARRARLTSGTGGSHD